MSDSSFLHLLLVLDSLELERRCREPRFGRGIESLVHVWQTLVSKAQKVWQARRTFAHIVIQSGSVSVQRPCLHNRFGKMRMRVEGAMQEVKEKICVRFWIQAIVSAWGQRRPATMDVAGA